MFLKVVQEVDKNIVLYRNVFCKLLQIQLLPR